RQLTQNGFRSELVGQAWEQWSTSNSNPFRRTHDFLGLATAQLSNEVKSAFVGMLSQIQKVDASRAVKRFTSKGNSSAIQRKIFIGLKCPPDTSLSKDEELTERLQLLSRMRVLHFDFETVPSTTEAEAVEYCRTLLKNNSNDDSIKLWQRLCQIAEDYRG